jgi:UPF0755 protein
MIWRHVAANTLTLLLVALFLGAGAVTWGVNRWSAPGPLAQPICLRVEAGSTMRRVAEDLAAQGAVPSAVLFRIGTDYAGLDPLLKQGNFLIPEGASMQEIARRVTDSGAPSCGSEIVYRIGVARTLAEAREIDPATGDFVERAEWEPLLGGPAPAAYSALRAAQDTRYRVVVAEGTTAWQVVTALNALEVLDGDLAEIPPEGRLAPASYELVPGTPVAELVARMVAAQDEILAAAWQGRAPDLPVATPEEALTLASIVEKETAIAAERPLVASVLVNRLNRGDMRLQFDPTIIYGITRGRGSFDRRIRVSDIQGETERELHGEVLYNTYVIDGLPPGPIANPGRAAIEAALNPAQTPYLFFVADGSGGHAFAETLAEHEENVARLRALEAEQEAETGGG